MVTTQTFSERSKVLPASPAISVLEQSAIQQSAMLLPFDCNSLTDSQAANEDAFYALNAVFQQAAFSEVQFVNLMDSQIDKEIGVLALERNAGPSLDNLQFFRSILDRHVRQIRDVLRITKWQGGGSWPSATKLKSQKTCSEAVEKLIDDYDGLLIRALDLCERCTQGMGVMMNRAIVAESKKAIDQAERLKKLTLLASFFIPLSFTTSLFGTNFSELAPGNYLSIWVFFAVSIPVIALSYCFYLWDIAKWIEYFRKWVKNRHR